MSTATENMNILTGNRVGNGDIEDQLAEAGVVLGEVVDVGLGRRLWSARRGLSAVEVGRAIDLEAEFQPRVARVEAWRRRRVIFAGHHLQRIRREVARLVHRDDHLVVLAFC